MADHDFYLEAPIEGESPFVDIVTPTYPGNDNIIIHAGRPEDPVPQHWEIVRGVHVLTCSADVANRKIAHKFYGDFKQGITHQLFGLISATNVTANLTGVLSYSSEVGLSDASNYMTVDSTDVVRIVGQGHPFMLKDTDYYTFYISGGVVADLQYVAMTFKYLNHILGITKRTSE